MQIFLSEDRNLQKNKTKTVQGTANGVAGIYSLLKRNCAAVCTALLKRGGEE